MSKTYPSLSTGSVWEKERATSNWHFEFLREPQPGLDSYTAVCRFEGDFTESISLTKDIVPENNLTGKQLTNDIKQDWKKFTSVEINLAMLKANPYLEHFDLYPGREIEQFQQIADALGLEHPIINFNIQRPGQILAAHIDGFNQLKRDMPLIYSNIDLRQDPSSVRRFVVMLDDWKLGQFFHFGNAAWHQWRAGDCVTWEWQDIPHCTGNAGYWDRPMLQITGLVTDKTRELLKNASKDLTIGI